MNKKQAIALLNKKQSQSMLTNLNTHWANLSVYAGKDGWWLNVPFNKFSDNLYFILNNKQLGKMLFISIPKNSIANPRSIFRDKENTADIFIAAISSEQLNKTDVL
ncbi:MAG: hypothetical protein R8L53_00245, partial [Mariprofundales bacterium]